MSFRPTVSVYVGGRIADISLCRNWLPESLLMESVSLLLLGAECKTREEYLMKRYGATRIDHFLFPERIPNTEAGLKKLESCSELPILVDLDTRNIYVGTRALSAQELRSRPNVVAEEPRFLSINSPEWETRFFPLLERGRLDLSRVYAARARALLREAAPSLRGLCPLTRAMALA